MKDICYWEAVGFDTSTGKIRLAKFLLVIDDNNFAKYKFNLSKMGIASQVDSYEDFLELMPTDYYNHEQGKLKDESTR